MGLLNEAVNAQIEDLRTALSSLEDDMRSEAARMAASGFTAEGRPEETLASANSLLTAFHRRHLQSRQRILAARMASLPADDDEGLRRLQSEMIALRKEGKVSPSLTLPS